MVGGAVWWKGRATRRGGSGGDGDNKVKMNVTLSWTEKRNRNSWTDVLQERNWLAGREMRLAGVEFVASVEASIAKLVDDLFEHVRCNTNGLFSWDLSGNVIDESSM